MNGMKKMLSLLLVALLLVTVVPFAALADGEITTIDEPVALEPAPAPASVESVSDPVTTAAAAPGASATTLPDVGKKEVNYSVLFVVKNVDTKDLGYSSTVAVFSVSSDAKEDAIRAAAAGAVATAGYATVNADAIVQRVSANGNASVVHNVRYGAIRTKIDTANKQFKYILEVTARPEESNTDVTVQAAILLDKENTGKFENTGKTVPVTLVKTTYGTTETYSLKTNGGATVDDIKGVLGANYKNKTLSMTMQGPSANGEVTYRVTVLSDSGSTGTNIPNYDGTGNNNGGISNGGSNNNNNNNNNNGSNGTMNFPATVNFRVNGKVVYQAYVTNQTQLDAAKAHVVTVVRNMGYQVTSWNGF